MQSGVPGTPTFLVKGSRLYGAYESLRSRLLSAQPTYEPCAERPEAFPQGPGAMFWFSLKRFVGSYSLFNAASRA
jgi:hypothetical protein